MRLRPFAPADLLAVHQLICDTIDACYPTAYPPRAVAYFKQFHSPDAIMRRAEAGTVLVAQQAGEILGTGALVDGEISAVFVDPRAQGVGLGAVLMDALERTAREQGRESVGLHVSLPSKGFYERLGYRLFDEGALDVGGGETLGYWEAVKTLSGGS